MTPTYDHEWDCATRLAETACDCRLAQRIAEDRAWRAMNYAPPQADGDDGRRQPIPDLEAVVTRLYENHLAMFEMQASQMKVLENLLTMVKLTKGDDS